jgi:hypothetical protein
MAKKKQKDYEVTDHQLYISSVIHILRLFSQNNIDPKYRWRASKILLFSILSQPFQWLQKIFVHPLLMQIDLNKKPPLFVIGHWRSGTTHLHYLLSRDKQFGILSNYQAFFFKISWIGKGWLDKILNYFMPETRPQDNIKMNAFEPAEEEQPLTNITLCAGMHSMFFPDNLSYYKKFNLFEGIKPVEKKRWARKYQYLLKMISLKNKQKPLLLKNPHNTSRVKELHELFPQSKFIYIHRDPIDVFLSNRHLYTKTISTQYFSDLTGDALDERIIYCYKTTLQKYLKDRSLLPKNQLIEIFFGDFEKDELGTIEKVYRQLEIPGFEQAKPELMAYLESVKDYQKNEFRDVDPALEKRLREEWAFAYKEWNYDAVTIQQ